MSQQLFERTMALAGIFQALNQVQQLTRHSSADMDSIASCLNAILVTNPDKTSDVYKDTFSLKKGYELIINQLGDNKAKDMEITRYLVGLLALERKLARSSNALNMLAERITQVHRQLNHFDLTSDQVIANFAGIYSDIISPLGPKLQITGNPEYLKRPQTQEKIRALLLSAMRSAVLWRQLGGKRRYLIFNRKSIVDIAKKNLTLS